LQEESPRNGETLALPSGKLAGARPNPLEKTVRQASHKGREADTAYRLFNLAFRSRRPYEMEVRSQASVEEDRFARQIADIAIQALEIQIP